MILTTIPHAKLLQRLEAAWSDLTDAYSGLAATQLTTPGVSGDWSIKDILAHISTWEQEALHHLPTIIAGGHPPRYAATGGIDAFNARNAAATHALTLDDVLDRAHETHQRLLAFLRAAPSEHFSSESRARRRLRLDTYGHYRLHAAMIRAWRNHQPL